MLIGILIETFEVISMRVKKKERHSATMIKANISLRDRIQFNNFKWQSSCIKNLRDTVICRSLCDKLCIRGITELLRMREAK